MCLKMLQTHKTGFKFWGRQESAEVMPKAQACNKFSLSLSLACTPIKETYFEKEIHHVNVHDWCNIYSYYLSHTVVIHIVDSHRRHTSVLAGWIHRNPYLWFQWILTNPDSYSYFVFSILQNLFANTYTFGTSIQRCRRSLFRWLTGNDVNGHYFRRYILFFSLLSSFLMLELLPSSNLFSKSWQERPKT